jgi:hypothetical protein
MTVTSLPTIIQNLPDALLGDAKNLSQRRYRLAVLVAGAYFGITFAFGERTIGDGRLREF